MVQQKSVEFSVVLGAFGRVVLEGVVAVYEPLVDVEIGDGTRLAEPTVPLACHQLRHLTVSHGRGRQLDRQPRPIDGVALASLQANVHRTQLAARLDGPGEPTAEVIVQAC
jgi:hypothetical protein